MEEGDGAADADATVEDMMQNGCSDAPWERAVYRGLLVRGSC
jgi:hypothetical protein